MGVSTEKAHSPTKPLQLSSNRFTNIISFLFGDLAGISIEKTAYLHSISRWYNTFYTSYVDMWCSLGLFAASTMTLQCHSDSDSLYQVSNSSPPTAQNYLNSLRMYWYAHLSSCQTPFFTSNMDVGHIVWGQLHHQPWKYSAIQAHVTQTLFFWCFTMWGCTHMHIQTAFQGVITPSYMQHWCGMQSESVCSFNNDTAVSFRLTYIPRSKISPHLAQVLHSHRLHPHACIILRCYNFRHTSNMDVRCSLRLFAAPMTSLVDLC